MAKKDHLYQAMLRAAGAQAPMFKRSMILAALSAAANGVAFLGFYPLLMALQNRDGVALLCCLLGMSAVMILASYWRWRSQDYEFNGDCSRATHQLRTEMGVFLRQLPLQVLSDKRAGEINALVAGNIDEVLNYSPMINLLLSNAVITPVVVALGSLYFDWRLGLLMLLILLLIFPAYYLIAPLLARNKKRLSQAHSQLNADFVEYAQGLFVLKSAKALGLQSGRLAASIHQVQSVQQDALQSEAAPNLLLGSVLELLGAILLLAGTAWIDGGSLSAWTLAAILVISARFAEPLTTFLSMMGVYETVKNGYQELSQWMAQPLLPILSPTQKPAGFDIQINHLCFSYHRADHAPQAVLNNINLEIKARSMLALVGASGSGKTTITRALMRYSDADSGSILLGGADIRHIPSEQLIDAFSVVFQDVYLFDDSIANNIKMSRPDASDEAVIAVAKRAKCHDFISALPQGYATSVGDIGSSLSGGERQRISIARALLKDAPIVILDEPTAQLDTYSELAVQQAIDELVQDKTVIVIAHRLSTIVGADQIAVVEKGEIVELGNHATLLAQNGRYAQLWQAQL